MISDRNVPGTFSFFLLDCQVIKGLSHRFMSDVLIGWPLQHLLSLEHVELGLLVAYQIPELSLRQGKMVVNDLDT